jgi:AsmA protein
VKLLKYALYLLATVLAVAVAVAGYVAATFDPNAYKDDLVTLIKDKTQRTLTIEGDIGLTFFPKIGVKLGRTALSEYRSETEFAGIERARVALALLPLLSRKVVVDEVVVEGLRATVIKRKDGSTNLDDLLGGDEEPAQATPPPAAEAPAQPIKLDVQGMRISNAALTFRDEQAGVQYAVTALTLETGRISPGVPTEFNLAARLQASSPQIDLNARLQGQLDAKLDAQAFTVTNLRAAVDGRHATDRIDVTLDAPSLTATPQQVSAAVIGLTLKTKGPQLDSNAAVKVSGLEASAKTAKMAELAVDLNAKQAENAVQGRLVTPLAADLETQTVVLPAITGKFDIRSPATPVQPLTVTLAGKANADLKKQSANADLALKVDQSSIKATLGMSGFAQPRLRFDAAVDRLDLGRYASTEAQAREQKPAAGGQEEAPIDLSALKTLNLAGRLRIGELVAAKVKVSNVQIDVQAQGGRLEINPLLADLYQGRVRGAIGVDANRNQFSVKQSLSSVAIGPLLKDALAQDLLEGRGDIAFDLTAAGATVSALKRSLSGGANLKLADGAIKGVNLAQSLRNAKNTLSLNKDSETAAALGEKTDFSELVASFSIRNGKARNEDLSVKSPFLRLNGAGDVDIVQGRLDYLAKVTVVASPGGQGGKELADLTGLTVPVRISGPLSAPKFKLELSSALAGAAKSRVEQKKEALKSKLESRLQEKLLGDKSAQPPAEGEAADAGSAAPAPEAQPLKPEDELKKKLRGLLR